MNLLTTKLINKVFINGKAYAINTDFRSALMTMLAFESSELTSPEKTEVMLKNLYHVIPEDVEEAIKQATIFLNAGEKESNDNDKARVFSFDKDSGYIFSAFRQTHGIDLQRVELHWHEFLALFMDLGSETVFCTIVGLRTRLQSGKATKEEKELARSLGEILNLPEEDTTTLEEREANKKFLELVKQGEENRRLQT